MGKMTRRMVDAVITQRNWQPYITSHWMDLGRGRGGVTITFHNHEQFQYKCSHQTADEILSEAFKSKGE